MNDQSIAAHARTVTLERVLPGPIERVWEYLVDGEKRKTWFAGGEFERRVGGKARLEFDHSRITDEPRPADRPKGKASVYDVVITKFEPPHLLGYTFPLGGANAHVTFELSAEGKGVRLLITHREVEGRGPAVAFTAGWDAHVQILEDRLNGNPPRGFWSLHAKLEREYDQKVPK